MFVFPSVHPSIIIQGFCCIIAFALSFTYCQVSYFHHHIFSHIPVFSYYLVLHREMDEAAGEFDIAEYYRLHIAVERIR